MTKKDKAHIGIVCYPTAGGSGVVATELGKGLAFRGYQVHFISTSLPARMSHFEENLYFHQIEAGEYPLFGQFNPHALSVSVKIREVADRFALDIVHVHYAIPHAASAFLAREMLKPKQIRTVTTLHGTDITLVGLMPSFYEITRFSVSVSDAITAVSAYLKQQTVEAFKIEKPIQVIHNFVDCNEFKPSPNRTIRNRLAPGGEKLIMHISNFRKVKNLPSVVHVFNKVKVDVPCRLVLLGDGPEREPTETLCADLGILDDVSFMGEQEFVADILPVADVFLLPSSHESFGLSALEAMSCGVPVVASNVGGLHEVVTHGQTGYLCAADDIDGMAAIVRDLFHDDTARKELGLKAREHAKRNFGKDKIIDQYIDLYNSLLSGE